MRLREGEKVATLAPVIGSDDDPDTEVAAESSSRQQTVDARTVAERARLAPESAADRHH